MRLLCLLAAGFVFLAGWGAAAKGPQDVRRMAVPPSAAALLESLEAAGVDQGRLRKIASGAPPHSPVRESLEAGDAAAAQTMLAFRPRLEAPLPEGFPGFTPVGLIEVKRYPAYRRADGPGFWPLFQHIQKQGIPMTAPVEMNVPSTDAPSTEARSMEAPPTDVRLAGTLSTNDSSTLDGRWPMAFLYQSRRVGKPGPIDGVEVVDVEPATFVSLGLRGGNGPQAVADARRRLVAWVEQSETHRVAAGDKQPFRVLGYSSPMVPKTERYWEVQLRVVSRTGKPADTDSSSN